MTLMFGELTNQVLGRPDLTLYTSWPVVVGLVALVLYGLIAAKRGQNWFAWGLGGGLGAFLFSMLGSGIANAVALPYVGSVIERNQTTALICAIVLVGIGAVVLFFSAQPETPAAPPVKQPAPPASA